MLVSALIFAMASMDALPDCDMIEYTAAHEDCRLELDGDRHAVLTFGEATGENEWGDSATQVRIDVRFNDGELAQSFDSQVGQTFVYPSAQDVNGDGELDLLLPQYTGNVNTSYILWAQQSGRFVQSGELNAVIIQAVPGGLINTKARSSAASWEESFYRLGDAGQLEGLFGLSIDLAADTCRANDWGGLPSLGLTETEAAARYCGGD